MKKINYIDSIRNPIITEKATILSEQNKTVFKVHEKATKKTIKKNIEKLFKVNVIKVNIINQKSKLKMKQGRKSIKSEYKKCFRNKTIRRQLKNGSSPEKAMENYMNTEEAKAVNNLFFRTKDAWGYFDEVK